MARMDQGGGLALPITEDMIDNPSIEGGLTPQLTPLTEDMIQNPSGDMPMMSDEEKRVFTELFKRGVPEDMIIDIMASAKVGATLPATAVNPAEFGGLPNTGSSPAGDPSMPTAGGTGGGAMSNQDMTMYLQNKVNEIKSRTGGATTPSPLGALPMARPNTLNDPSLNERTSNPNMNQPMNT